MRQRWIRLGVISLLAVAACNGKDAEPELRVENENGESIMVTDEHRALADRAVDLLSGELGVARADVRVVAIQTIDWPNGALGCPKPGHMYTQAIVPGHKITLEVADRTYLVHEGNGRMFVCMP